MTKPYEITVWGGMTLDLPEYLRLHDSIEYARAEARELAQAMRDRGISVAAHPVMIERGEYAETVAAS